MIKLGPNAKIEEAQDLKSKNNKNKKISKKSSQGAVIRPEVVDAKVYKLKSAFVKNSVFITLSYVETPIGRRPIEIFINSKDLNRAPEYVVLTRLISAIFRRATDPMFIIEPPPPLIILGRNDRIMRYIERTFNSIVKSQSSSEHSKMVPWCTNPAQFTRMSGVSTSAERALIDTESVTSSCRVVTFLMSSSCRSFPSCKSVART